MEREQLRPVYMLYPGLHGLLIVNYWVYETNVPIAGIMLSIADEKYKGKPIPFLKLMPLFIKRSGWRYSIYMLFIAKLAVLIISIGNFFARLIKRKIKIKTFADIAKEKNIPIFYSKDFNGQDSLDFMKKVNANLVVSIYNNQILKSHTINWPKFKTINIHDGYLPDFRGVEAPFETMYHQVKEAGVTTHYVDTGVDTGDIILQELLPIQKDESLFSLSVRLWLHGAKMLPKVLAMIEENRAVPYKQSSEIKYPYKSYPEKERVNEFIKRSGRLITWEDIVKLLR